MKKYLITYHSDSAALDKDYSYEVTENVLNYHISVLSAGLQRGNIQIFSIRLV